ncbi:peptidylprolyl isomerase [Polaribacter huanghezhanensis]|uniref:peptidylprolyl isomerase n=1 Tax=Polaribacter huanghezhanensis TaxID=1354726 RepID=UPI002648EFEB|nr:peptidylprolyl isomerase [Polaribacter huanghezhanensis]
MNKIDGVDVVVGKNVVLSSDIAKFKLDIEQRSEGKIKISDCEMLEQLMLQKLLSHHAVIDSVLVTETEVNSAVDRNLAYFTQQFGSIEKVVKEYGFNDLKDLRTELFSIEKENALVAKEQQKINEGIDVTPEEVRIYYNGLKNKNELPEFQAEIELSQIVLYATPTKEEIDRVIKKLSKLKKEIEAGASFKLKAVLNSDDPSAAQNGGQMSVTKDSQFIKEFKEVAFSLDVGQVSEPFKTLFGYHIIQLHEIKGKTRIVSHILIQPEILDSKIQEIKEKIEKIRKDIIDGKITFEEAVLKYSEDKDTKNSEGMIVNPYTNETRFDLTRMDPSLYARVINTKKGEITDPFYDETQQGEKMYKIILMKDRTLTHKADLVNDYVKVQKLALQKKKEENITKWAKNKIEDTYIKISDKYNKCVFQKNWKKENE